MTSWRSAKRRRLVKLERRRWYAQLQFSRQILEEHFSRSCYQNQQIQCCVSACFAKDCKRRRFDKLERRRGKHCLVSADEDFSRLFVEEVQQLV
ncbi:hypothetical protein F511_35000 [Dorcoceras hygrometricum]|uniref:Uncharacterized protein n=1 Tax=Dorcoceras hygrometricum TaxID=472368 RepID=A0A2Z7CAR5_9LAMI|nr:hypothetical protein F511_35000 [Dorcoceras hygrometricum]